MQPLILFISCLCLLATSATTTAATPSPQPWARYEAALLTDHPLHHAPLLDQLYTAIHYQPLWFSPTGLNAAGKQLVRQYRAVAALGAHPLTTPYRRTLKLLDSTPVESHLINALDVLLSDLFFHYTYDILSNRLLEDDLNTGDHAPSHRPMEVAQQPTVVRDERFNQRIRELLVQHQRQQIQLRLVQRLQAPSPQFNALLQALEHYQQVAASGEWRPLTAGPTLEPGMQSPRVASLRFLLQLYGDLPRRRFQWALAEDTQPHPGSEAQPPAHYFDSELATAVKRFQARHGLPADGKVGPQTRAQLNVAPEQRVRQLAHNLRRLYHLPAQLGGRHIMINMADYRLRLIDRNAPPLEMKVIIGREERRTPIMTQRLGRLVLSPRWNVPRSIAIESILPQAQQNPGFLKTQNISIVEGWSQPAHIIPTDEVSLQEFDKENFPFRFMQHPGRNNALGKVKFLLSNNRAIYLHDTPQRWLFSRNQRAISAGCVRLEHALELTYRLLADHPDWPPERIEEALAQTQETYVRLTHPVPVYVMYWTAWVDDTGVLQFRPDIYDKDRIPNTTQTDSRLSAQAHQDNSRPGS